MNDVNDIWKKKNMSIEVLALTMLGIKNKFYMHVQQLAGESPLLSPLSSLPLCSLLYTNFSFN